MNTNHAERLFDIAERRLNELDLTDRQIEFLLSYLPESNRFLMWLIASTREEIIRWGEYIDWGGVYA